MKHTFNNKLKDFFEFIRLFPLLEKYFRVRIVVYSILNIVLSLINIVGTVSIFPFLALLSDKALLKNNKYFFFVYENFHFQSYNRFLFFFGLIMLCVLSTSHIANIVISHLQRKFRATFNIDLLSKSYYYYLTQNYLTRTHTSSAKIINKVKLVRSTFISLIYGMFSFIQTGVFIIIILYLMVIIDPLLSIIFTSLLLSIHYIIYLRMKKIISKVSIKRFHIQRIFQSLLQESLKGFNDIKLRNLEYSFSKKLKNAQKELAEVNISYQLISTSIKPTLEIIAVGCLLFICLYFVKFKGSGIENFLPQIGLMTIFIYRLLPKFQELQTNIQSFKINFEHFLQLKEDTRHTLLTNVKKNHVDTLPFYNSVKLSNITFKYPNTDRYCLKNINMTIEKNQVIGIAGETGCGKTTIANIVAGFIAPNQGELTIDNVKIDEKNIQSWQKNMGYVSQNIFLLDTTIKQNIAFGVTENEIDMGKIKQVAKIAQADEFIERFSNGYHTKIGEDGIRISGGQAQRIAIARAFYFNVEFIIFDEATSSIDGETERKIIQSIQKLGIPKTFLMIAHRLNTLKICDNIYYMEEGEVKDKATYENLCKNNKFFGGPVKNRIIAA